MQQSPTTQADATGIKTCLFCGKTVTEDRIKCPSCGFDPTAWNPKEPVSADHAKHETNSMRLILLSVLLLVVVVGVALRHLKMI